MQGETWEWKKESKGRSLSPGSSDGRVCLKCWIPGFDPWVVKIPWRRAWQLTSVFLTENSMDRGGWGRYSPWCHKELDTTEQTTLSLFFLSPSAVCCDGFFLPSVFFLRISLILPWFGEVSWALIWSQRCNTRNTSLESSQAAALLKVTMLPEPSPVSAWITSCCPSSLLTHHLPSKFSLMVLLEIKPHPIPSFSVLFFFSAFISNTSCPCVCVCVCVSSSVMSDALQPHGL